MSISDAAAIRRVLGGDTEAFRILTERYYDDAHRYASYVLGNQADAEDVVQETFVRAYRYLRGYHERDRFRAWLWRILVNRCRTRLSEQGKTKFVQIDLVHENALNNTGDCDTSNELDRKFIREELARAIFALPSDQREAVVMHFADGLSYPEMSAATGTGVSALKMRVHRACDRLRAMLANVTHD